MAATRTTKDRKLSGKQKAAVLLIALGPERSANVLKQLREAEIEQLTLEIVSMEQVSDETRHEVLDESYQMGLASGLLSTGGFQYAQEMLSRALGDTKAHEIIARLAASIKPHHFEFLKDTDPSQLASFLEEEPPQVIALILAHLPATLASRILANLPAELQPDVALRIATMERTLPEVIEGVESVLRARLSAVIVSEYTTAGGVDYLVKMLSNADRSTERGIMEYLDQHNPELADEVRKLMFMFDNLSQLDDRSLQRVLRDVDARDLSLALRNASDELRERIFRNLSSRAADMLREDMSVSGRVRMKQVEEAQTRIVAIARRLDEAGEIVIQHGAADEFV